MTETARTPQVSVVIGTRNRERFLGKAIESVLSQTVEDLELIVADDGSTDGTPDVVRRYGDRRLAYIWGPHVGISRNLNRAVARAQGPFIAFLDSDDWSYPQRLERQLEVMEARPEVAVVGFRLAEASEDGTPAARARTKFVSGDLDSELLRLNCISNSCALVRRTAFEEVGGFDPAYSAAVDWDLWLRIADRHVVHVLDEVLGVHRRHLAQISTSREREQIAAGLRTRAATLRRRRKLAGASGLIPGVLSYCEPRALKRLRRRYAGQVT